MKLYRLMTTLGVLGWSTWTGLGLAAAPPRLNILLFTADDLGYEVFTDTLDLTPHLDHFAGEGLSFTHAHMNTPICQPSRAIIATGRYAHSSGMMGFFHLTKQVPTVMQTFRDAGYRTGILGKVNHSTPDETFTWDFTRDYARLGAGRNPERYYEYSKAFFTDAKQEGTPFYFMVNSHDPHRPFHDPVKARQNWGTPSRLFSRDDVEVPSYLADLPNVRLEISHYYNSVRRLDDTFGRVMQALRESGQESHTLVLFVSDNGSAFPFAKANAYFAGTRTPCFWRWPGVVQPGTSDRKHLVSSIDFFPTFVEAAGLSKVEGTDGRSLVPLLKGGTDPNREYVFTQIDYKIGGPATPMRCVQNRQFGYLFNPWSRPGAHYKNNNEGQTMKAMEQAAESEPAIAARVQMFRQREVEEFYDLRKDPGSVVNLIDHPEYREQIETFRRRLETWMKDTDDPALAAFRNRKSLGDMEKALQDNYPTKLQILSQGQKLKQANTRLARKAKWKDRLGIDEEPPPPEDLQPGPEEGNHQ